MRNFFLLLIAIVSVACASRHTLMNPCDSRRQREIGAAIHRDWNRWSDERLRATFPELRDSLRSDLLTYGSKEASKPCTCSIALMFSAIPESNRQRLGLLTVSNYDERFSSALASVNDIVGLFASPTFADRVARLRESDLPVTVEDSSYHRNESDTRVVSVTITPHANCFRWTVQQIRGSGGS